MVAPKAAAVIAKVPGAARVTGAVRATANFVTIGGACTKLPWVNIVLQKICFAPDTPLLTPEGSKQICEFQPGDQILSAPENNPSAPPRIQIVEEVFKNEGRLFNLHVRGKIIRTTALHPFYVLDQGWKPAVDLEPGDMLRSHDGQWVPVEGVADSGEDSLVYNLRVSEDHTYFVGGREWGFSAWAHNLCAGRHHFIPRFFGSTVPYGSKLLSYFNAIQHTRVHLALSAFLRARGIVPSRILNGLMFQANYSKSTRIALLIDFYTQYQNGVHLQKVVQELLDTIRAGRFK